MTIGQRSLQPAYGAQQVLRDIDCLAQAVVIGDRGDTQICWAAAGMAVGLETGPTIVIPQHRPCRTRLPMPPCIVINESYRASAVLEMPSSRNRC